MARNQIQFQKGLSTLGEFTQLYGPDARCESALERVLRAVGFRCPRCVGKEFGFVYGRRQKPYYCPKCCRQVSLTAGTIMEATKLPLTTWFQAPYLIGQAKKGISALEWSRHLGVACNTAWLLHSKILQSMSERVPAYVLRRKIQMDDAYLGGERLGGKVGRVSKNKVSMDAAVSLNVVYYPIHKLIPT